MNETGTKNSYKNNTDMNPRVGGYVEIYFSNGFLNILWKSDNADTNKTEIIKQWSFNARSITHYEIEGYDPIKIKRSNR